MTSDLRGAPVAAQTAGVLEDPTGRRRRILAVTGRVVALVFFAWLVALVLGGLGILPSDKVPLGRALQPSRGPAALNRPATPALPSRSDLAPAHAVVSGADSADPGPASTVPDHRPAHSGSSGSHPASPGKPSKAPAAAGGRPTTTPGNSGSAPGHSTTTTPGKSSAAPGHSTTTTPGKSSSSPGHSTTTAPGHSSTAPGHSTKTTPGPSASTPGSNRVSAHKPPHAA